MGHIEDILTKIEGLSLKHDKISPELVKKKNVKIGLRNADGSGVIAGITTKGRVVGYKKSGDNKVKPVEGKLYYCGYDVEKLIDGIIKSDRFGFDESVYLLLTGILPSESDLSNFSKSLAKRRQLTRSERGIIMQEVQNENQMYALHSVTSHMGRTDPNPDSINIKDVSRQCINLIAKFPTIVAANNNVMKFRKGGDLRLVRPKHELSTAENFLYMLKGKVPEKFDAKLFDMALILHAEHGGGNNSTFTVRTVSSSGANTYMAIAAGIASLSGHLHGGANESVHLMMKDMKKKLPDWTNEKAIKSYITDLIAGKVGNGSGKIYGLGHAVYTYSDPRAEILRDYVREYADQKGALDEFEFYEKVEKIATNMLSDIKQTPISANVDYYSGLIYKLMGIPRELYTPIFAMSRVAGWSAHRIEQIVQGKIMRPAYISASTDEGNYVGLGSR